MRKKRQKNGGKRAQDSSVEKVVTNYLECLSQPPKSRTDKGRKTKEILLAGLGRHVQEIAKFREERAQQWLLKLKGESSEIQDEVLKRASKLPRASKRLFGEGLNTKATDLGRQPEMPWDGSLARELKWAAANARFHATTINAALQEMGRYDRAMIEGQYDEARAHLVSIVATYGQSIWAIEADLLLEKCSKGLEANKRAAKRRCSEVIDDLTKGLIDCTSQKCEQGLSENSYEHEFNRFIAPLSRWDTNNTFTAYFRFHLNRYSNFNYTEEHLAFILHHDSTHTFLDYYRSLVGVLQLSSFKPLSADSKGARERAIRDLQGAILDRQLVGLSWICDPGKECKPSEIDPRAIAAVEAYTIGDYKNARDIAVEILKSGSCVGIACELIARSESNGSLKATRVGEEGCLAEAVIKLARSIAHRSDTALADISRLRRLAQTLSACSFGYELHGLALQVGGKGQHGERLFAAVHSSIATPRMSLAFMDMRIGQQYLEQIATAWGQTATFTLFKSMVSNSPIPSELLRLLPQSRVCKYLAAKAERSGQPLDAITQLESLRSLAGGNRYLLSYAAERLAWLYMMSNRASDATSLVVDLYLRDPNLLINVSVSQLTAHFEKKGWAKGIVLLPTVVLYYITHNKAHTRERRATLFAFYQTYLNQCQVVRPTELPPPASEQDRALLVFFLRHICVIDIMIPHIQHSHPAASLTLRGLGFVNFWYNSTRLMNNCIHLRSPQLLPRKRLPR